MEFALQKRLGTADFFRMLLLSIHLLGNNVLLGVGVTIAPNVKCGSDTILSAGAVATKDISNGMHLSDNFAIPHDKFIQNLKKISL